MTRTTLHVTLKGLHHLYQWLYMYKPFGTGIMMACVHSIQTCTYTSHVHSHVSCLLNCTCMHASWWETFFLMREGRTHSPMSCTNISALTHIPATHILVVCSVELSLLRIPQVCESVTLTFHTPKVQDNSTEHTTICGHAFMHCGCMISLLLECRDCEFWNPQVDSIVLCLDPILSWENKKFLVRRHAQGKHETRCVMYPGELTYLTHMYVLTIKEPHLSVIRHADGSSHFYVYIYMYI